MTFLLTLYRTVQYLRDTPEENRHMTTPTPLTPEERLSRLEGVYEHLATKADIAELKGELKSELHKGLRHNLYITVVAVTAAIALVKYLL